MTHEDRKKAMYDQGRLKALALQEKSPELNGTELYAQDTDIPSFLSAKANKNMLNRKAGSKDGFVCLSTAGRVVRLIQSYDSDIYPGEPETLPAQWGFVWSTDPAKALPFVALSTSPYGKGDCCSKDGIIYRSRIDNNVYEPGGLSLEWEEVTE